MDSAFRIEIDGKLFSELVLIVVALSLVHRVAETMPSCASILSHWQYGIAVLVCAMLLSCYSTADETAASRTSLTNRYYYASSSSDLQDQASQNYERQQARTEQQQARQGQGEYYVPTYFANPYQSYQQLLTSLAAEEQLESEQEQLRQLQQQFPVTSSKFPSLVSPSISLSGHDGLSKYKPSKSKAKSAAVSEAEFRNLLASIKAIQPVVNERLDQIGEYIKEAGHRENAPQRGRTLPAREVGQAEYLGSLPYQWSRDASEASAGTGKSSSSKVLPFQAEGMANPYDEISDEDLNQEESDTVKRQGPAAKQQAEVSARGEPKARRKLTNESPSSLHNDRNVVLAPKAYQQSISDSVSKKESILGNMSDVYFVGKWHHFG